MHHPAKHVLSLCGGVLLTVVPAFAAGSSMHTDTTQYDTHQTIKIGNTELQPGSYVIRAKESQPQLDILQNDKVVATVPCQWVRLNNKASESEVLSNNNQVTEVEFRGRSQAAKIG